VARTVSSWDLHCSHEIAWRSIAEIQDTTRTLKSQAPRHALPEIRRLAELCLCSDHRNQKSELIASWKKSVLRAEAEHSAGSKHQAENRSSMSRLAEERREREKLQTIVERRDNSDGSTDSDPTVSTLPSRAKLSAENMRIEGELRRTVRDAISQKKNFEAAAAEVKTLKTRIELLQAVDRKKTRELERFQKQMETQKEDFIIQLEEERKGTLESKRLLQQGREAFKHVETTQAKLIKSLQGDIKCKNRCLESRASEIKERAATCASITQQLEQARSQLAEAQSSIEELKLREQGIVALVTKLELDLSSEREKTKQLQGQLDKRTKAEEDAKAQLDSFKSTFLEEQTNLQKELNMATKRRTELIEEVESLRNSARVSIIQLQTDIEDAIRGPKGSSNRSTSIISSIIGPEGRPSLSSVEALPEPELLGAAKGILIEEINLLREQLASERMQYQELELRRVKASNAAKEFERAVSMLKIEKYKLQAELTDQQRHNESLENELSTTKDKELFTSLKLTSTEASLRHAQAELGRSISKTQATKQSGLKFRLSEKASKLQALSQRGLNALQVRVQSAADNTAWLLGHLYHFAVNRDQAYNEPWGATRSIESNAQQLAQRTI
jgi:chromosome segregation ATPase